MHIIPSYLQNPTHPITVCVIGCGGTGSQVMINLARISYSLQALGHPGLYVVAYDPDDVSASNVGRQIFSESDIGLNKAILLVSRINAFYGKSWEAIPKHFDKRNNGTYNFTLTCVDNISSRLEVASLLECANKMRTEPYRTSIYWMDFGNAQNTGQVVLDTLKEIEQPESKHFQTVGYLPIVTERFNYSKIKEKDSGPSCSHADALKSQNLFINSTLAQLGYDIIWEMLRERMIGYAGFFLNLKTKCTNPIPLEQKESVSKKKNEKALKTTK